MNANDRQVDGTHYMGGGIQPWDYIESHNMPYLEGCVVKYITRWRDKGGITDLRKAIHALEKRIEIEQSAEREYVALGAGPYGKISNYRGAGVA